MKLQNIKSFLTYTLLILLIFCFLTGSRVVVKAEPFKEVEDKIEGISSKEKEVLQNLFSTLQEIEEIQNKETKISKDIENINREIKILEEMIKYEEIEYKKKQNILKETLKSYQRLGPASYLEIILSSDSLTTFLRRINALRDLTKNTGELLEAMEESKNKLSDKKMKIDEKLEEIKTKQEDLRLSLKKKIQLMEDQERYLASLGIEREFYQQHLDIIKQQWREIPPLFTDIMEVFLSILEDNNLPIDTIKTSFSLFGIKGILEEETLNNIILEDERLPIIVFNFYPGKVEMKLPEKHLKLKGAFILEGGDKLKFQVDEGSFYEMPLETGAIETLFGQEAIVLNLKPLLKGNTIHSIEILKGQLELTIKLSLF